MYFLTDQGVPGLISDSVLGYFSTEELFDRMNGFAVPDFFVSVLSWVVFGETPPTETDVHV